MIEALEYLKESKEGGDLVSFIKKYNKLNQKDAKMLREKLEKLDLIKLDDKVISKIIDTLPENSEELNRIFVGMSADEEEANKIIEIIKGIK